MTLSGKSASTESDEAKIESTIFPKECVEYIMNRQGAKSSDPNLFSIVSVLGQKFIEECLKKSIETTEDGRFVIRDENLRNMIKMENPSCAVNNDFNLFLMPNQRYKELLKE
ncbi:Transcription initiation factor TFIID 23-30kDa subunit family protein [Cryptosporidium meleagridis]|uniref:Transcription initiation factor TFIID 23-30kDa subunit family protein n=1 Tax=Cryptosporidium meleagridis TaxID=93969 RepID=A0A2P4YZT4_9CRYT|nr:Transcription initiation factor TFIID 23-30kDa subunit family protein [Cryptosporidium meleagridis]